MELINLRCRSLQTCRHLVKLMFKTLSQKTNVPLLIFTSFPASAKKDAKFLSNHRRNGRKYIFILPWLCPICSCCVVYSWILWFTKLEIIIKDAQVMRYMTDWDPALKMNNLIHHTVLNHFFFFRFQLSRANLQTTRFHCIINSVCPCTNH